MRGDWLIYLAGVSFYIWAFWYYLRARKLTRDSKEFKEHHHELHVERDALTAITQWHAQHGNHLQCGECYLPMSKENKEIEFFIERTDRGRINVMCGKCKANNNHNQENNT